MKKRAILLWPFLLSLVFTLLTLQWSFDRFRLTSPPFLDDVNWINEGLAMLDSVRDGGVSGLLHHVVETRTLAPYSIVAAAGFALFGIADWVPYFANGWLIFSLLLFLEVFRRREHLPLREWFLGAAVALSFPISGYSIVSFLGDNATGLFIAIGSIAFLRGWPSSESALESWTGTLAWIIAFYGKATLFPETMLIFAMTAVLGYSISARESRAGDADYKLIRKWSSRAAVVLLAVLPYYILVARALYGYLYLNNFGASRQIWAFKGTSAESLRYYVTGLSGETMLGPALYVAAGLVLFRAALLFRDDAWEQLRFAALMVTVAITYALPTWMVNKTTTVGSPFQFLVVLAAVACLYAVLKRFPNYPGSVALILSAAVILAFRFPVPLDRNDSPAVAARNRTMDGLMTALETEQLQSDEPVFLTTTGYISANTLKYEFRKRHLPMPRFYDQTLSDDPARFQPMIDMAAYVIATEAGNDDVFYPAPSAFIQAQTLAMVQQSPAFEELARFTTWRGKHYYLFGRRERVNRATSETLVADISSRSPVLVRGFAGAMPDHTRWSRREFEIEFPAPRGLYAELKLRVYLPQSSIDRLGPITLRADIPREGRHSETFGNEGIHEFTYRYAIQQPLVSTVRVRFRVDKAMKDNPGEELGLVFIAAELNAAPE